jgi:hypothetical protein
MTEELRPSVQDVATLGEARKHFKKALALVSEPDQVLASESNP